MCNVYFWATRILKCAIFNFGAHGFNVQLVSPKIKHCTYMYIFWVFFCCSQLYKNVMIKSNGNLLSRPSALSCCTPRCRSVWSEAAGRRNESQVDKTLALLCYSLVFIKIIFVYSRSFTAWFGRGHFFNVQVSLRSKRFQSSNCAKVGARAKKNGNLLKSQLSRRTRAETLTTKASFKSVRLPHGSIRLFRFQIPLHLYWFVRLNRCLIANRLTFCSAGPPQRPQKFFKVSAIAAIT